MGDSRNRQKPPIDKKSIRKRLESARERQALVRLRRWIPESDQLEGFVVARSRHWVLLAVLSDRITLDGWTAVRLKDVQAVTIYPEKDCFEIKALQARQMWPPVAPEPLDLTAVTELLRSASTVVPMVGVFREFDRPDVCWIGAPIGVTDSVLSLLEVNVAGGWARKPRSFDVDDITRVDLGGGYEEALALVAGPPPATSR